MIFGKRDRLTDEYEVSESTLRSWERGVGTLTVDGVVRGHLASMLGEMVFPSRAPWPWFVVVWLDGSKEPPFEDYGPDWWTVRQLDAGTFTYPAGPGTTVRKRFLGVLPYTVRVPDHEVTFEFAWLPSDEAAATWERLGLEEDDF